MTMFEPHFNFVYIKITSLCHSLAVTLAPVTHLDHKSFVRNKSANKVLCQFALKELKYPFLIFATNVF